MRILSNFVFIILIYEYILVYSIENNNLYEEKNKTKEEKCEEKHNKSYCNFQKYGKTILIIIIGIIIIGPIIIIIIFKIIQSRRNFQVNNNNNQNQIDNNKKLKKKKKVYLFKNILTPIYYSEKNEKNCTNCTICLDNFSNKDFICLTPCMHAFHYKCIKEYILKTDNCNCPNCKFNFFSMIEKLNIDFDKINENDIDDNENIIEIHSLQNNMNDNKKVEENNNI